MILDAITSVLLRAGLEELLEHFPGWSVEIIRWRSRFMDMDPKCREALADDAIADLADIPSRVGKMMCAIWFIIQPPTGDNPKVPTGDNPKVEKDKD